MKVIIQPCTGYDAVVHYNQTILHSINIKNYKQYIKCGYDEILKKFPSGFVNFWGLKKGDTSLTRDVYDNINDGDIVLFQRINNDISYIDSCCFIKFKLINFELGKKVWLNKSGKEIEYRYLYFVNNINNLKYKKIYTDDIYRLIGENKKRVYHVTLLDKRDSDIIIQHYNLNQYIK